MTASIITIAGHTVMPVTLSAGIDHYLRRKQLRGAATNTLAAYGGDLRDFAQYADRQGAELVGLITDRLVERWLDILGMRGLSPRSQARKLCVLRSFVRHGRREGWLRHDPTKDSAISFEMVPKVAPEMPPLLAMLEQLSAETPLQRRDRALMRLALDAALRVGDLVRLDMSTTACTPRHGVDFARLTVNTVGKGGKVAVVPINERTAAWLDDWLTVRARMAKPDEPALFVSNRGRRMTRQQMHNRVQALGAAHGIERLSVHLLRHRRVGDVVERLGLEAGQHLARHKRKSTTANVYGAQAAAVVRHVLREHADLDQGRNAA